MKKKRWFKLTVGLLSILLIADIIAGFYFYDLAIKREQKDFLVGNQDLEVSADAMDVFLEGGWREWYRDQTFETWEIQSFDGLTLEGKYLQAEEMTNRTVIFAHGYLGRSRDMALYGEHYYEELGYNTLKPDLRGHGNSEGDYIGFGWHDRLDIVDWVQKVIEQQGEDAEIVLHGLSMGAATVLMASGEELPDNVKAVVADSPYTSSYDLFKYQMERMYNLPSFPILPTTNMVTNLQAGYTLSEASALDQVKQTNLPVLYLHGDNDMFVPTYMAEELYENTSGEKEIHIFKDAGHGEAYALYPSRYMDTLGSFLMQHME
ncbi:alpha/beta hydrolase [Halalkalibacillus halophilus]|uniref:alpha/beta hydrolase n=1 Tax=Halalkalibacillus halophilus TaxID=392827 RepID=UPI00041F7ADA|nr:alpha/beta hydrolase [Halalkalibacillus halophilus]